MTRAACWMLPLIVSCGAAKPGVSRLSDGSYRLQCKGPLVNCLERLEKLCKQQNYVVSEAEDRRDYIGHEQGQQRIEVRTSYAIAFCGERPEEPAPPPIRLLRPENERIEGAPPTAPQARACVPGATQACIGPGACAGGQACDAAGLRFGPCDCGNGPGRGSALGPTPPSALTPSSNANGPPDAPSDGAR